MLGNNSSNPLPQNKSILVKIATLTALSSLNTKTQRDWVVQNIIYVRNRLELKISKDLFLDHTLDFERSTIVLFE